MPVRAHEPLIDDATLEALALAADPDAELPADAVPIGEVLGATGADDAVLPAWYMPPAMPGPTATRGWRRRVAVGLVATFLAINAAGLCSTYGWVSIA